MVTNCQRTRNKTTICSQNNHGVYLLPSGYSDQRSVSQWASDPCLNQTPPVAGWGPSQLLLGISVFVTLFLATPTPHPWAGAVQPSFPPLEEWILLWKHWLYCPAWVQTMSLSQATSVASCQHSLLFSCTGWGRWLWLPWRAWCVWWEVGGGVTDVLELNKTVHQNSQCSKRIHSLWKTGWQVFKKLKIELLYDLGFHFWVFTQKKWKQRFQQICVHPGA